MIPNILKIYADALVPTNGDLGYFGDKFKGAQPNFLHGLRIHLLRPLVKQGGLAEGARLIETPEGILADWKTGKNTFNCGLDLLQVPKAIEGFAELFIWYTVQLYSELFTRILPPPTGFILPVTKILRMKTLNAVTGELKKFQNEHDILDPVQLPIFGVLLTLKKRLKHLTKVEYGILKALTRAALPIHEEIEALATEGKPLPRDLREKLFIVSKCSVMSKDYDAGLPLWGNGSKAPDEIVNEICNSITKDIPPYPYTEESEERIVSDFDSKLFYENASTKEAIQTAAKELGLNEKEFVRQIKE